MARVTSPDYMPDSPYSRIIELAKRLTRRRRVKTIYHYTSPAGLLGILETGILWASDIWFLNDQMEFVIALELAGDVLEEYTHNSPNRFRRGLYHVLTDSLESVRGAHVFVASFSENADQLSQWRGYCPTASGYSIGLSTKGLVRSGQRDPNFFVVPCIYDETEQRELIVAVLEEVLSTADSAHTHDPDNQQIVYRETFQSFASLMAVIGPAFKHRSFDEEQEWRAVSLPGSIDPSRMRFRAGSSMLIPYCEFPLLREDGHLRIQELVVGPTLEPDLAKKGLEMVLAANRVKFEQAKLSDIPYRNW